jgi:hypothetical protein
MVLVRNLAADKVTLGKAFLWKVDERNVKGVRQRPEKTPRRQVRRSHGRFEKGNVGLQTLDQCPQKRQADPLLSGFRRDTDLPNKHDGSVSWGSIPHHKSNHRILSTRDQAGVREVSTEKEIQVDRIGIQNTRFVHQSPDFRSIIRCRHIYFEVILVLNLRNVDELRLGWEVFVKPFPKSVSSDLGNRPRRHDSLGKTRRKHRNNAVAARQRDVANVGPQ